MLGMVLGGIIGVLFTFLGLALVTGWVVVPTGNDPMVRIFGGLMSFYGIYRIYRVYLKYQENEYRNRNWIVHNVTH